MKFDRVSRLVIAIGFICSGCLAGCGGGSQRPPTYPVEGTVTIGGKPLADATITFRPDSWDNGQRPANGQTDADGRYQLTTFSRGDGAMEGSYRITITQFEAVASEDTVADVDDESYTPPEGPLPTAKNRLPKNLADPEQSGLTARVEADASGNTINFTIDK